MTSRVVVERTLVETIRVGCELRGWLYKDLARRARISPETLSRIMRGVTANPHQLTVDAIMAALEGESSL